MRHGGVDETDVAGGHALADALAVHNRDERHFAGDLRANACPWCCAVVRSHWLDSRSRT